MSTFRTIAEAFEGSGLHVRGGFHTRRDDDLDSATVVLVGAFGTSLWAAFERYADGSRSALDTWTERTVTPVARTLGAQPLFPWQKPYRPFQRWAMRAEPVFRSPLGILIHPDHGLWHAYRAALLFPVRIALPRRAPRHSPCETCADRPCLTACPVGAFTDDGYDVAACARYLAEPGGSTCLAAGCRARAACPVGAPYPPDQVRFHMAAFARSVVGTPVD